MRYDSEHKAKTRERVLEEASTAIRLEGPDRIGVAAVMARAGLTHGGFYAHFSSKDDLVAQAIGFMFEERYSAFLTSVDATAPRTALLNFVTGYLSMGHRDAIDRGCPIPVLAGDVPRLSAAARETFVLAVDRLTDALAKLLRDLNFEDAEYCASSMLSEMVGALALSRIQSDRIKAEKLLDTSRQSIVSGFGLD